VFGGELVNARLAGFDDALKGEAAFGEGVLHRLEHAGLVNGAEGLKAMRAAKEAAGQDLIAEEIDGHPRHIDGEDDERCLNEFEAACDGTERAVVGVWRVVNEFGSLGEQVENLFHFLLLTTGDQKTLRGELLELFELHLPERAAVPVEESLVAAHPGGFATTQQNSGEAHDTRRKPSVRILARRPPWPFSASSAPSAKAWFIQ